MRQHNISETLTRRLEVPQVRQEIQVIEFEPEHVKEIDPTTPLLACAEFYKNAGPAYTALQNGQPIAAAGLVISGNEALAWGCISQAARNRPFFLHRTVVNLLALEFSRYQITLARVLVDESFEVGRKWVERMGFKETNKMVCYEFRR